jgi:hypothetical protein
VIQEINGESLCLDGVLNEYKEECVKVLANFEKVSVQHVQRKGNEMANGLAQQALGYQIWRGKFGVRPRLMIGTVLAIQSGTEDNGWDEVMPEDWKRVLIEYILEPGKLMDRKIRRQALRYTVVDGVLYQWGIDGLLLKCLGEKETKVAMVEVHEGMCVMQQTAHKMKWMLKRAGMYWPNMLKDCFKYYQGCESCQQFGKIQIAAASTLHPIIKPWPFR